MCAARHDRPDSGELQCRRLRQESNSLAGFVRRATVTPASSGEQPSRRLRQESNSLVGFVRRATVSSASSGEQQSRRLRQVHYDVEVREVSGNVGGTEGFKCPACIKSPIPGLPPFGPRRHGRPPIHRGHSHDKALQPIADLLRYMSIHTISAPSPLCSAASGRALSSSRTTTSSAT